jgi:potassium-transporting ATPase KdpC subunit
MRILLTELRVAMIATLALMLVCCGIYPLLVYGVAQVVFPSQANGSLLRAPDGQVIGSALLAQPFDDPRYFHPRPSAAGNGYDAENSGGSNLGPLSQRLVDQVRERVAKYRSDNDLPAAFKVPADAVTASGSGLDPHISLANAQLQAGRVARVRGLDVSAVMRLVRQNTNGRQFGILGEPGVNVLQLNLALDRSQL